MKSKKTKEIHIRLSEKELTAIKIRASKFQSLTQFIFAAIQSFDDTTIQERMDSRKRLAEYYKKTDEMLAHVGGNLNQAMRRVNEAAKVCAPTQALIINGLMPEIRECHQACNQLRKELLDVTRNIVIN